MRRENWQPPCRRAPGPTALACLEEDPLPPALALAVLLTLPFGARATPAFPQTGAHCCTATIQAHVPRGTGPVYLSGSLPQLGPWRPDALAMTGTGRRRSVRVTAPRGTTLEYKFTLGSWEREAL